MMEIGTRLYEERRRLAACVALGVVLGVISAFLLGTRYTSRATVIPAASSNPGEARIRGLASQLGLADLAGLSNSGQATSPEFLIQVARSPAVLQQLARRSVVVPQLGATPREIVDVIDPLGSDADRSANALEIRYRRVARKLGRWLKVWQIRETGSVKIEAITEWPTLSQAMVLNLIDILNEVNLDIARGQAREERRFVEQRLAERQRLVLQAEERMEEFLRENREYPNSPRLSFAHDRLEREVSLQRQLFTSVAQALEDVRIREVRDVAVVTVVEPPLMPIERDSRRLALRAIAGFVGGLLLGILTLLPRLLRTMVVRSAPHTRSASA